MNTIHKLKYVRIQGCNHEIENFTGKWSSRRKSDEVTLGFEIRVFGRPEWFDEDEITDLIYESISNHCNKR